MKFIYCLLFQIGYLFASQQTPNLTEQISVITSKTAEIQTLIETLLYKLPQISQETLSTFWKDAEKFNDQDFQSEMNALCSKISNEQTKKEIEIVIQKVSKTLKEQYTNNEIDWHDHLNYYFILKSMSKLETNETLDDVMNKFLQLEKTQNSVKILINPIEENINNHIDSYSLQEYQNYYTQKIKYLDQSNFILKSIKQSNLNIKEPHLPNTREMEFLKNHFYQDLYQRDIFYCSATKFTAQDCNDAFTVANAQNKNHLPNDYLQKIFTEVQVQEKEKKVQELYAAENSDLIKQSVKKISRFFLATQAIFLLKYNIPNLEIAFSIVNFQDRSNEMLNKLDPNVMEFTYYPTNVYALYEKRKLEFYNLLDLKSFFTTNNIQLYTNQLNLVSNQQKNLSTTKSNQKGNSKIMIYLGISAIGVMAIGTALYFIFQSKP